MKPIKMTSFWSLLFTPMLLLLLSLASMEHHGFVVEARHEFKVGDDFGWQEPTTNNTSIYTQWASMKRFRVGDSLLFEYKNDSVLEVEKWGYYHCNTSNAIFAFNNGKSVINLDRPGPFYFISGTFDHCKNGQRLLIQVMSQHPAPQSLAAPPDSYQAPGPLQSPASAGDFLSVKVYYVLLAIIIVGFI